MITNSLWPDFEVRHPQKTIYFVDINVSMIPYLPFPLTLETEMIFKANPRTNMISHTHELRKQYPDVNQWTKQCDRHSSVVSTCLYINVCWHSLKYTTVYRLWQVADGYMRISDLEYLDQWRTQKCFMGWGETSPRLIRH